MSEAPIILSKWQRDTFSKEQAKSKFAEFIKIVANQRACCCAGLLILLGANNWLKNWLLQILRQPLCGDKGKVREEELDLNYL